MTHSAHGRMPDAGDGAGMKKTQLGQGHITGIDSGELLLLGGGEEDAARPRVNSEEWTQGELL